MMTEWGPYNFAYPLLWWTNTDDKGVMHFDIIGPAGKWTVKKLEGVKLLSASGELPGKLTVKKENEKTPVHIELEYKGRSFVTPFGENIGDDSAYTFSYTDDNLAMQWQVQWFRFNPSTDPVKEPAAFASLLKDSTPVKTITVNAGEFERMQGSLRELPRSRFATVVNTDIKVAKGNYRFDISAGDLVRVYVDNKLVIDSWKRGAILNDADYHHEAVLPLKGKHHIRIVKAQYGGYGMLDLKVQKLY
jgi:hypothetical protein